MFEQTFDKFIKELQDGTLRLTIRNLEKQFYTLRDASDYIVGAALLKKINLGKIF